MADKKTESKKASATSKKQKIAYKDMALDDLYKAIEELRTDVAVLKRGTIVGDVQNVRAYNARRKELARALTARNAVRLEEK